MLPELFRSAGIEFLEITPVRREATRGVKPASDLIVVRTLLPSPLTPLPKERGGPSGRPRQVFDSFFHWEVPR